MKVATHPAPSLRMNEGTPPLPYTPSWPTLAPLYLKVSTLVCFI